jgi:hypothetical protein
MSAKRYPPPLDWVELGAIAAAPLADVCGGALVVVVWEAVVSVGVVALCCEVVGVVLVAGEVVVLPDEVVSVGVVVPVDVAVPVEVAVPVPPEVAVLVELVVAGGGGVPGVGGSVEALGPVTSAPFLAVIVTNA